MGDRTVGNIIKAELRRRGKNIDWLAEETGVSRQSISGWINKGVKISDANLGKLQKAIGLDPNELKAIQSGIAPAGDLTTERGRRLAKKIEVMPEPVQEAVENMIEAVRAAADPDYWKFEGKMRDYQDQYKARDKKRDAQKAKKRPKNKPPSA